jgi:predicted outer membrane repeat protein
MLHVSSRTRGVTHPRTQRPANRIRPRLEPLEERAVPAVITVLNPGNDGPGSLRDAIVQANTLPGPDTIAFAPAVTGTITLTSALPDLSTEIQLHGPGSSVLTVARSAAPGTPSFRIFTVPAGATVAISGLTLTGGDGVTYGGGIYNSGTLTVSGSTITGNHCDPDQGGGIYNSGTLTVTGSTFSKNAAPGGAGISNNISATLTVTGSTFSDNSGGYGGGIANEGMLTVTGSTFSGGSVYIEGGGIDNGRFGTLTVTESTFSGNSATWAGGGIYNLEGMLTVNRCTFGGNVAHSYGGGVYNGSGQTITITGSTFSGNWAPNGGGIANIIESPLTVTSCTFSGNSAQSDGGGIYSEGSLTVVSSTLSGNSAGGSGGGIATTYSWEVAETTVSTSVFANPVGGNIAEGGGTTFVSLGHNLFTDQPAVSLDPTDLVNTEPLLGPLADNGGPTFTCALLPGSPAIDAGVAVAGVTTDQRGVPLPQGSAPDIGAFESRGFALAVVQGDNQEAPVGVAFPAPLVVRVTSPYGEPVAGGQVTFTAPAAAVTALLNGNPATIGADGLASVTATAGGITGTYPVVAGASGVDGGLVFNLTNVTEIAGQGLLVLAPAGSWFTHQVATFQVTNLAVGSPGPPVSTFRAWVNWGDGTYSAGQVKLAPDGTYQIVASHRYKKSGTFRTTTQILAWPPGIVLSEVQGKVVAGGKFHAHVVAPLIRATAARRR